MGSFRTLTQLCWPYMLTGKAAVSGVRDGPEVGYVKAGPRPPPAPLFQWCTLQSGHSWQQDNGVPVETPSRRGREQLSSPGGTSHCKFQHTTPVPGLRGPGVLSSTPR